MLNYNHLYYFHTAAAEGSIANAAHRLGVSQGTVSEQVRTLERTLRVSLFERQPGGLKLFVVGRFVFVFSSVMFRAGERLAEALGHDHGQMPRTLRIGLTGAGGRTTTANFLFPLLAIPDCVPSIRGGDAGELIRELRANELDLVLCESEPPDSALNGLEISVLERMKLVAVAAPTLPVSDDWSNVALLHYRPSSAFRWDVEEFLEDRNLRPRIAAESDDSLFLIEAAARGGYVAFVPSTAARDARTFARRDPCDLSRRCFRGARASRDHHADRKRARSRRRAALSTCALRALPCARATVHGAQVRVRKCGIQFADVMRHAQRTFRTCCFAVAGRLYDELVDGRLPVGRQSVGLSHHRDQSDRRWFVVVGFV